MTERHLTKTNKQKNHEKRKDNEIFNSENCEFDPGAGDYFRHAHAHMFTICPS